MRKNLQYIFMIILSLMFTACPEDADVIPIACFEASATEVEVGELISFKNCSQDAEYYSWDFGDNGNSTEVSPAYSYDEPGLYTVTLTAHNKSNTNMDSETIRVLDSNIDPELYNGIPSEYYSDYIIENFETETNFATGVDNDRSANLVGGVYQISIYAEYDWIFWAPKENPGSNTDYEIEFSLRYTDYTESYGSGILWGSNDNADKFYFYFLYPDGQFLAGYYEEGWQKWFDFTSGGNALPTWNKLTLRKVGNKHYGFMNENLVFEEDFNGNFGVNFGLYIATGATVEFDFFNTRLIGAKKLGTALSSGKSKISNKASYIKQK